MFSKSGGGFFGEPGTLEKRPNSLCEVMLSGNHSFYCMVIKLWKKPFPLEVKREVCLLSSLKKIINNQNIVLSKYIRSWSYVTLVGFLSQHFIIKTTEAVIEEILLISVRLHLSLSRFLHLNFLISIIVLASICTFLPNYF